MTLTCSCGARFKSMYAEARHRHNFPALCRPPKGAALVLERFGNGRRYWAERDGVGYEVLHHSPAHGYIARVHEPVDRDDGGDKIGDFPRLSEAKRALQEEFAKRQHAAKSPEASKP